jgi:hypothetical protein
MQRKTRRSMRFLLRHNKDLLETLHFLSSSDSSFSKLHKSWSGMANFQTSSGSSHGRAVDLGKGGLRIEERAM